MNMFCFQCEQAAKGKGCEIQGVCGKKPEVAALQDLLVYKLLRIAVLSDKSRLVARDNFIIEALFSTVTNVDFDPKRLKKYIDKADEILETNASLEIDDLIKQGQAIQSKLFFNLTENSDVNSLKSLLLFGLKGMAAYYDHASILGQKDEAVISFFYKGLNALAAENISVDELISLNMEFGQVNLKCLELLDKANTQHFGHPVPTKVSLGVKKGLAILVSGHDLLDLEELLKQTEGKGINIYTHGEMLPAHGYPALKKYKHLAGNYGGAWQDQYKEFAAFPGAILMTTNCIQRPADSYKNRIFTTGLAAWPEVVHISDREPGKPKDFSPLIEAAKKADGFEKDEEGKEIMVGFGRNAVMSIADEIIEAIEADQIKHFFLIGGCDGAKPGRNYYTEFAQLAPKDTVVLTLACGKYRFNKLDFGDINGIPRLLDIGQCNDAYSAIQIALALSKAFNMGVNELPLSLILSWYEQKAVCILLTLLSLGIKNIKLGPSLPAFISPNVLKVLVEKFNIAPVKTAQEDLKEILEKKG